jgi:uncharacterized membrane protein
MASIQRSLLIEAPISFSFEFWTHFERYPSFMEDVARVAVVGDVMTWDRRHNGDTVAIEVRVLERVPDRMLSWRCSDGRERGAVLTFAPLEGDATWFTFTLDYEADERQGDAAGRLTATSRRLDRELQQAREMIEQAYVEGGQHARQANG